MSHISYATCHLCEANCGVAIEHDGARVLAVRGDKDDPASHGHICPKAAALADLHHDPDRLRRPLKRTPSGEFVEISWDAALDEVARRLTAIQRDHGRDSVAVYFGNPTLHSYSATLYGLLWLKLVGTRNFYSSNSVDALPRLLTSYLMYGSQAVLPVPDIDRTQFMMILGANPMVSNGSVMTAPNVKHRLAAIRDRGGRVVVIDPRYTETARHADRHYFIHPGTDALLLLAMLHSVFKRDLARPWIARLSRGGALLPELTRPFSPARVAPVVGIAADDIEHLTEQFVAAPSAVCYGRLGTCAQEFGAVTSWLIDCLNIVTGNLDRPGGAMFASPAIDLAGLASLIGQTGSFDRWRSRVSGLPEFNGELPAVALAEEIDTPGKGQIRALVTHAGNPALSLPNGKRLEAALQSLDFNVAIDIYRNETTKWADIILPPTFGLERDHYALAFHALSVRNGAKYSPAVFDKPDGAMHDWEIFLGLATRMMRAHGGVRKLAAPLVKRLLAAGPKAVLQYGLRFGASRITLDDLLANPHGVDMGPLEPRLPGLLRTGSIDLTPAPLVADLARVEAMLDRADAGELRLIGRRHLRSNNSWMHNAHRLVKGKPRCTLLMHPTDADTRGLQSGQIVTIESRIGKIQAPVEITDDVMPGVVSLPHGWGHDRPGIQLNVAAAHAGVSVNDITDQTRFDALSGCGDLSVPVQVTGPES